LGHQGEFEGRKIQLPRKLGMLEGKGGPHEIGHSFGRLVFLLIGGRLGGLGLLWVCKT